VLRFTITASARKDTEKLPPPLQTRLEKKLRYWQASGAPLQYAAPLVRHHHGSHRFRVGAYRVIVKKVGTGELRVLRIRHRKDVYRD